MIKFFRKIHRNIINILLIASFCLLPTTSSFAIYEGIRDNTYYGQDTWSRNGGSCSTGEIPFNPLSTNKDANWKFDNPTCIGFITGLGASMVVAGKFNDVVCAPTNIYGSYPDYVKTISKNGPEDPVIGISTTYKIASRTYLCARRSSEIAIASSAVSAACPAGGPLSPSCIGAQTELGKATADATRCCAAYSAYFAVVTAGISALAIIHAMANNSYKKARICGHNWNVWKKFDINGDEISSNSGGGWWRKTSGKGSYQDCLDSIFIYNNNRCSLGSDSGFAPNDMNIKNKYFREYIYGGMEYGDNGSNACVNPTSWSQEKKLETLGYASDKQRYYMKGPGQSANYACHRFLSSANPEFDPEAYKAYECCKNRSKKTICIENSNLVTGEYKSRLCNLGERCMINGVSFEPYISKYKSEYLCAKTYSVCPYDHLLGGGTEFQKYETDEQGKPTSKTVNFCQYLKHCVKVPVTPHINMSNLRGAYISSACRDLQGDSQNVYSFNSEILPMNNTRAFSAPIAQCFKETMQNLILNKAGHTKCKNPDETPSADNKCSSGYAYINGQELNSESPFIKIQENLRGFIKLILTLAIIMMGAMVLLGMQPIKRKQIALFVIKVSLLMYFALGTGWQDVLVEGVLATSSELGDIMMKIDEDKPQEKLDGCQFPRFDHRLDPQDPNRFKIKEYPDGLGYLRIWDALDCKLVRAIGFGPDVTVPNLVLMIVGGLFTGGLGLIFVMAAFSFAFFFLALILRALHIFLLSTIAILLLIFVSPLIFTAALFEKTKQIYDGWLKQMMGFILQPVILFAYLGVFISIFEFSVVGDVSYRGDGLKAPKQIICSDEVDNKSLYCIFRISKFKTYTGLEAIGIGIPVLVSLNDEKVYSVIKAALLMFIFMQFMDKISTLAQKLVGGSTLRSNSPSMSDMMSPSKSLINGVRKRAARVAIKGASKIGRKGFSMAKSAAKYIGDKGKKVDGNKKDTGKSVDEAGDRDSSAVARDNGNSRMGSVDGASDSSGKSNTEVADSKPSKK